MKKFTFQIILLLVVTFASVFFYKSGSANPLPFLSQRANTKVLTINNTDLKVEIADTQEARGRGLGGREKLPANGGMLFLFANEERYPFWMKGLSFPLDFIWIKGDTVVDITPNVQAPQVGQADETLPIYTSKVPVNKVLEVNAGVIEKLNIKVGDVIKLR